MAPQSPQSPQSLTMSLPRFANAVFSLLMPFLAPLWPGGSCVAQAIDPAKPVVAYAGGTLGDVLTDALELSDGSVLMAGSVANLNFASTVPKTQLAPMTIPNRSTGRTACVVRVAGDLQSILGLWHLPAGQALNFRWIKTTAKPGDPAPGAIYLSGRCDATSGDYFIARFNGNFVTTAPTAFDFTRVAKATNSYGDNLGLQTWDVGGDGRVAFVDETGTSPRVFVIDSSGALMKLPDLRGSHWLPGVQLDGTNRQAAIGSDVPAATVSAISFGADLRSWTDADRLMVLPDGNGGIKRGMWPLDLFFPVQDRTGGTTGAIEYGYTGYRSTGRYRIGGIAVDRDDNDLSIGFNIQTRFWDAGATKEQPDFEPAVISYTATGALKWWSRLYQEVSDANGNGQIDPGETRLSSPDQYVDGLTHDHATTPARLVVLGRCHGNNTVNLWRGNNLAASPGAAGFMNQFTGTEGDIHIGWIGKFRETDGVILNSTYLAGYQRASVLTQNAYTEAIHDAWPSHNAGWPNLTTTRAETGALRCDAIGRVYVCGIGPRMVTTQNAWQKLPRITQRLNEGISPWSQFVRVMSPDLRTAVYSSALTGVWTYPTEGAQPSNSDNTDLSGVCPVNGGVLAVGEHKLASGAVQGNAVPASQTPAWGSAQPLGGTWLVARLPFAYQAPARLVYDSWRDHAFPPDAAPARIQSDADYDGDGLSNAVEFMLGLTPSLPDAMPNPSWDSLGRLQINFTRPAGRSDVQTLGESSSNLIQWSRGLADVEASVTPLNNGTDRVIVRIPSGGATEPRRFLRLLAIPPGP
jgi:hypothetical protein